MGSVNIAVVFSIWVGLLCNRNDGNRREPVRPHAHWNDSKILTAASRCDDCRRNGYFKNGA